jgi:phage-related protein
MSNIPSTPRKTLSLTGLIEKSRVSSNDALIMLCEVHVVDRFNGLVEQVVRIANIGQQAHPAGNYSPSSGGISFRGLYFQPTAFNVDVKEAAGEIPEISFSMQDLTGIVRGYLENYQGGIGSKIKMILLFESELEKSPSEQRYEYQEDFTVVSASIDGYNVSLGLGATNLLGIRFPRRMQIAQYCQWGYKSIECDYRGDLPTCDRTLQGTNGCAAHDNAFNFGGFPGIRGRSVAR